MYQRLLFVLFALALTSGCTTTPDLSEWAKSSQELKDSVSSSQQNMLVKVNQSVLDLKQGNKEGWQNIEQELTTWGESQADFAKHVAEIHTSLTIMVAYANELSALASASEGGEEASDSLFESMTGILEVVSAPFTGSQAALEGSKAIVDKVSEIVTRIQGQKSLYASMVEMQPAVDLMSDEIIISSRLLDQLVTQSAYLQRKILLLQYGRNKQFFSNKLFNQTYTNIEKLYRDGIDPDEPTKINATKINAFLGVQERLRDDYRQYLDNIDAIKNWRDASSAQLQAVILASEQWRQAHQEAVALLKKCGGMRSLRKECGHLSIENLKSSIDWVKDTASKFKGEDDASSDTE